jgi:hypothetical protein
VVERHDVRALDLAAVLVLAGVVGAPGFEQGGVEDGGEFAAGGVGAGRARFAERPA